MWMSISPVLQVKCEVAASETLDAAQMGGIADDHNVPKMFHPRDAENLALRRAAESGEDAIETGKCWMWLPV